MRHQAVHILLMLQTIRVKIAKSAYLVCRKFISWACENDQVCLFQIVQRHLVIASAKKIVNTCATLAIHFYTIYQIILELFVQLRQAFLWGKQFILACIKQYGKCLRIVLAHFSKICLVSTKFGANR